MNRIRCMLLAALLGAVPAAAQLVQEDESPADRQLKKRLETTVPQLNFAGTRFEDVIQFFRDVTKSSIHVKWRALEEAGISKDAPVDTKLTEVSLETALRTVLAEVAAAAGPKARFGSAVRNGVLLVSTADDLDESLKLVAGPRPAVAEEDVPNRQLRKRLWTTVPMLVFTDTKIEDVFQFLRDVTKAKIEVRWSALERIGVTRQTPLSMRLREVNLETALQLILDELSPARDGEHRLDYDLRDGVLVLSTYADLGDAVSVRRHDIRGVVPAEPEVREEDAWRLIRRIMAEIDPPSWRPDSPTRGSITNDHGVLIVRQSRTNHERIEALLEAERRRQQPDTRPVAAQ
jgi:hypothetical protein